MEGTNSLFLQLAVVLGLSAVLGFVIKTLRLPLLVAYLVAGLIFSLFQVFDIIHSQALTYLPEIGIALVLFFIGMELDIKEIRNLGKPILAASLGQIVFSTLAGFLIAQALGFSPGESFYLGAGLAFSSTIVVVKLLLEKKELNSLYGKLGVGILLLEDLVAVILLMVMTVGSSFMNSGLQSNFPAAVMIFKGVLLMVLAFVLAKYVLETVFTAVAKSAELLFLSAVAWCFVFVAVSLLLGFSVVIGAFLAGVALANSSFHYEIQGKVKPLRDFFVTLFFVYLGSQVVFEQLGSVLPLIFIFTAYALLIKPLIFLLILGLFGFRKHTIFHTAIGLSQVSEFSLIVMVVGLSLGVVSQAALTAMALTGVISIIASSIMITYSKTIYKKLLPVISFFEHGRFVHQEEKMKEDFVMEDHVILVGAHRMGGEIMKFLKRERIPFLVLDFNPGVVQELISQKVHVLFGDLGDPEILEFINLERAKLVISTAQDVDDNLLLLSEIKRRRAKTVVICRAATSSDAESLYEVGADYVILPEVVSGDFVVQALKNHWPNMSFFKDRSEIELNKLSKNHLAFE
ncbi:MAG: cation:proton antiporter [bacterium]|nr:cation:proton antiporter [bacterium]